MQPYAVRHHVVSFCISAPLIYMFHCIFFQPPSPMVEQVSPITIEVDVVTSNSSTGLLAHFTGRSARARVGDTRCQATSSWDARQKIARAMGEKDDDNCDHGLPSTSLKVQTTFERSWGAKALPGNYVKKRQKSNLDISYKTCE